MKPKVLVLITDGINCNVETGRAFELAGATTEEVHLNLILSGEKKLNDYDIIAFSGGFSYGDDVKSGKILAHNLLKLKDDLYKFIESKKLIIGICNGFQVLTTLGILPYNNLGSPDVSLYWNDNAHFECRWVDLKIPENINSP
ncbi:MAG: phosphoribosylformylglycinamidine synthase subunit PurQ, partial [Candidatus Delongbacteria bacterium]|nr:phosphoribosylformylglycinamidine synthase subunit PurQ [Candidatus Delongbacteria bacterium]